MSRRWWWCNGETYIFPFFSRSLSSLCVIYHRGFSQYTAAQKTTKLMLSSQKIHCGIMKFKNLIFLSHTKLLLSVVGRRWCNGENIFLFSLAVFLLQNLCNLPLPPKGFSQSTAAAAAAAQNYINTYGVLSTKNKIHCGILKWYEI